MVLALLLLPCLAGLLAFQLPSDRGRRVLLVGTALAHLLLTLACWPLTGALKLGWLQLDQTGLYFLSITSLLFLVSAVYSAGYLHRESGTHERDHFVEDYLFVNTPEAILTGCLLLFLTSMTLVCMSQHFGLLWVAVEATTLSSAPLIYFHKHPRSLEATWKYLLICSVGIALALLGNFNLAAAAHPDPESPPFSLTLDSLLANAKHLQAVSLRVAFLFLVVGYGTKMGLAPMHTWLPDAHSESPSLVSALLSGAALNCAFLGILRAHQVCVAAGLGDFACQVLIGFGLLSMAVAAVFIIGQVDYKRMLAYSSVEHMGILALGIGLGGAGVFGALLHAVNHSLTKGALFLVSGNILYHYQTKDIARVNGLKRVLPVSALIWVAGFLAITGSPPFGLFLSEFTILEAALSRSLFWIGALYLLLLALIFVGMATSVLSMVYGAAPSRGDRPPEREPLWSVAPSAALCGLVLVLGLYVPEPLKVRLKEAAQSLVPAEGAEKKAIKDIEMVPLRLINGKPIRLADVPTVLSDEFRETVLAEVRKGGRLSAFFGHPQTEGRLRLLAVLAHGETGHLGVVSTLVGARYPALTPACPQAHWFEREIAEQWAVVPEGHPWLKPIRFHRSYRPGQDAWAREDADPILPSVTNYFQVRGAEVHEVAVGPVHAGIIEPGSFRFQCHGEKVLHLEISLGYQHRGVEKALVGGPNKRTLHYLETLAGDTTIGHVTAYCQALEGLARCPVTPRAHAIRGIALELERLANHTGDLGALAQDVGYLPTSAYCGRLRGDFLNSTAALCGNRFGRGLVVPGGVAFGLEPARLQDLSDRLTRALADTKHATDLLWETATVQSRFESTGTVSRQACKDIGLVGPAARACGLDMDVRRDFPSGIFRFVQIPVSTLPSGDVFARAFVRYLEVQRSGEFVRGQLKTLPAGNDRVPIGPLQPEALVVSLVEGWRGEICHVALTDNQGRFARYKIVDPSFHNWFGLALALRNQQISDFPLCNKSFNLSYCGHDL